MENQEKRILTIDCQMAGKITWELHPDIPELDDEQKTIVENALGVFLNISCILLQMPEPVRYILFLEIMNVIKVVATTVSEAMELNIPEDATEIKSEDKSWPDEIPDDAFESKTK